MSRIARTFHTLGGRNEGAFMPFLVIGDPDIPTCLRLTEALVHGGADFLEFGFPFSDPPADGPVIQAADVRALQAGVTPPDGFAFLDEVHRRWNKPTALLVYYNLILQYGVDAFYKRARQAGVDAILVADVPLEHAAPILTAAKAHRIAPISIVSELTTNERLDQITQTAEGFLYVVSHIGITGEQHQIRAQLKHTLARLRSRTSLPLMVGFGIAAPAHVRGVLDQGADGVICGSAIVNRIQRNLDNPGAMQVEVEVEVEEFCNQMKSATRPEGEHHAHCHESACQR
jgi:tryptophan synthase alpha chain